MNIINYQFATINYHYWLANRLLTIISHNFPSFLLLQVTPHRSLLLRLDLASAQRDGGYDDAAGRPHTFGRNKILWAFLDIGSRQPTPTHHVDIPLLISSLPTATGDLSIWQGIFWLVQGWWTYPGDSNSVADDRNQCITTIIAISMSTPIVIIIAGNSIL